MREASNCVGSHGLKCGLESQVLRQTWCKSQVRGVVGRRGCGRSGSHRMEGVVSGRISLTMHLAETCHSRGICAGVHKYKGGLVHLHKDLE